MTAPSLGPDRVTARVPAKINLELLVGPLREDGFHGLTTIYQAVNLHDEVTAEYADDWSVAVEGPGLDGVPADDSNLALRAARLLAERADVLDPVAITIHKTIPVAGGMAGGSADAAAALVACEHLWQLGMDRSELEIVAADLGSDVPFLLAGGTSLGSGRGELLAPVLARGTYHWVLAVSEEGLATPAVYAELDRLRGSADIADPMPKPETLTALRSGDPRALADVLENDLQEAAISLRPRLGEILSEGLGLGALGGIVSGSGPTIAFLVEDNDAALDLAVGLTASGTCADVRRATGPVHGAHVLHSMRA
jgi:4-diphosphocytidyl-2-C-methyl-D-erythritol kinase